MNAKLLTIASLSAAVVMPMATYAAGDMDKDRSSPKEFVKDSAITLKIKADMARDPIVSATHIKVDTDNDGVVTLSGTAKSMEEAQRAAAIAQGTKGVVSVNSEIRIQADR